MNNVVAVHTVAVRPYAPSGATFHPDAVGLSVVYRTLETDWRFKPGTIVKVIGAMACVKDDVTGEHVWCSPGEVI